MKMYGLFLFTYDYHEWEELECVARNKDKLIERAEELVKSWKYDKPIIIDMTLDGSSEQYTDCKFNERMHYQVCEVEVI